MQVIRIASPTGGFYNLQLSLVKQFDRKLMNVLPRVSIPILREKFM